MEPWELTGAVKELLVLSRQVGIELDDQLHPVDQVVSAIHQYEPDYADEMLQEVQAQEIRDRQQLAEAEAAAARGRVANTANEILERSGTGEDDLRSGMVTALMRNTPIPDTEYEAIEDVREIERAARATSKSIEDTDTRAEIMAALPASASPYGEIRSDQRLGAIQDSMVGETHRWSADLENAQPTLTHEETLEAQAVAKGEILAASQGPAALREYREEHGINLDEYA